MVLRRLGKLVKLCKVSLIADHTKKNCEYWYEMIINVRVHDDETDKELWDSLCIRIDTVQTCTQWRSNIKNEIPTRELVLITYDRIGSNDS
ncbi:hypothetical protein UACE39S_04439 [Ureibacillus acetophenoni]